MFQLKRSRNCNICYSYNQRGGSPGPKGRTVPEQ